MSFDPAQPANNSALSSLVMRDQLNSLNDLIAAIVQIAAAQVDAVTTLNPGDPASVTVGVSGNTLHFTFSIPRGEQGEQGPPFSNAVVDNVNTVDPGFPASVSVNFNSPDVHFSFDIPRGQNGIDGTNGTNGEVSNADLSNAIGGTSANSNGVNTLGLAVSDPPTQSEVQQIANKLDELINALRR